MAGDGDDPPDAPGQCHRAGRLRSADWRDELGGVRMIRGASIIWERTWIWGQLNGALG
jgi:hypothetical protein